MYLSVKINLFAHLYFYLVIKRKNDFTKKLLDKKKLFSLKKSGRANARVAPPGAAAPDLPYIITKKTHRTNKI